MSSTGSHYTPIACLHHKAHPFHSPIAIASCHGTSPCFCSCWLPAAGDSAFACQMIRRLTSGQAAGNSFSCLPCIRMSTAEGIPAIRQLAVTSHGFSAMFIFQLPREWFASVWIPYPTRTIDYPSQAHSIPARAHRFQQTASYLLCLTQRYYSPGIGRPGTWNQRPRVGPGLRSHVTKPPPLLPIIPKPGEHGAQEGPHGIVVSDSHKSLRRSDGGPGLHDPLNLCRALRIVPTRAGALLPT
ncbi:hypothetical protein LX36DRAFT_191405 [Colletotrichum falcatum]|nr:hypothetical protein LX36DRAFT_191405 [Colletotrichum falcatum]